VSAEIHLSPTRRSQALREAVEIVGNAIMERGKRPEVSISMPTISVPGLGVGYRLNLKSLRCGCTTGITLMDLDPAIVEVATRQCIEGLLASCDHLEALP
jgi:hypothetical protein